MFPTRRMRLLEENGLFRLFFKPPGLHSARGKGWSCVDEYESLYPGESAAFRAVARPVPSDVPGGRNGETVEAGFANEAGLLYRLDSVTSGLVMFARTPEAFRRLLSARIVKTYEAVCFHKRDLSANRADGAYEMLSERLRREGELAFRSRFRSFGGNLVRPVLPCEEARFGSKRVTKRQYETLIRMERPEGDWGARFEIRIVKGFRHQIRSVLASLGYPIDGDEAYGGRAHADKSAIALRCAGLDFKFGDETFNLRLEDEIGHQ